MTELTSLDETHDPRARSWLDSANQAGGDFPVQNLPFAVFRRGSGATFRGGVAIGDQIIDLAALAGLGLFQGEAAQGIRAAAGASLNPLMQLGPEILGAVRRALFESLREGSPRQTALQGCLVAQIDAEYSLPAQIGDYTDFYIIDSSRHGRRPDDAAGQPFIAELRMDSHWVPWPQLLHRRVRTEFPQTPWTAPAAGRGTTHRRCHPRAWTTNSNSAFSSVAAIRRGRRFP